MAEFAPCPLCGKEVVVTYGFCGGDVECKKCGLTLSYSVYPHYYETVDISQKKIERRLAKKWNRRADNG